VEVPGLAGEEEKGEEYHGKPWGLNQGKYGPQERPIHIRRINGSHDFQERER